MNEERRRYFRITEAVGLSYQFLDSGSDHEMDKGRGESAPNALLQVGSIDEKIESLLATLAEENPRVAEVVMLLNQKLERAVNQIALDAHLVGRLAQKVREANISACGIGFANDESADEGARLRMELRLYPHDLKLVTFGRVVGCDKQDDEKLPYYWRIDFYGMNASSQEKLIQHMVRMQNHQLKERNS